MTYRLTNDPHDPCSLCVQWEEPDDPYAAEAVPWAAPGVKAERLFHSIHDECQRMAIQYTTEASCENSGHKPCVCGAVPA